MARSPVSPRYGTSLVLARTVALVNVAGPPAARPPTCEAVADVLRRHGEDDPQVSAAELDALVPVLAQLFAVCAATDDDGAAAAINAIFDAHARRPRLTSHDGDTSWHLHVDASDDGPWHEWIATSGALALAQVLSQDGHDAWGVCRAPGCGRLFTRAGPGRRRRACSDRCATRTRVQAHRGRALSGSRPPARA